MGIQSHARLAFGPADQVLQVQIQGASAIGRRDGLQLPGERLQLAEEGGAEGWIRGELLVLGRPGPQRGRVRQGTVAPTGRSLEGPQPMGEKAQVVALQGRQQGGLQSGQLTGIDHGVVAGVRRNPQEWPFSSLQCTRSMRQSGKVWRISPRS